MPPNRIRICCKILVVYSAVSLIIMLCCLPFPREAIFQLDYKTYTLNKNTKESVEDLSPTKSDVGLQNEKEMVELDSKTKYDVQKMFFKYL